jgi:uncharacterized protein with ATP-grasp and redox domains
MNRDDVLTAITKVSDGIQYSLSPLSSPVKLTLITDLIGKSLADVPDDRLDEAIDSLVKTAIAIRRNELLRRRMKEAKTPEEAAAIRAEAHKLVEEFQL